LLRFVTGLYRDTASGILEGACGPLLIHTDKSKSKEKEAQQERVRQQSGETAQETITSPRFTVGLEGVHDVLVQTTHSGSMTQEVFFVYAKHFVKALKPDHKPVILFLDGHASRWNNNVLQYFMDNKVFTFFLASHTSIWSQPNDTGVNKRFHWAIEQSSKEIRRTLKAYTISASNTNFVNGWRNFLQTERNDLRGVNANNATSVFQRTGLFPLNPFCEAWTDAIATIGKAEKPSGSAHYEIFPNVDAPKLSETESALLRDGLQKIADTKNLHDIEVANIRGLQILSQWRKDIEKAVSEGEKYASYSHTLVPLAKSESETLAMRLVHFKKIESVHLHPATVEKTKEEKVAEVTRRIVCTTKVLEPISVTYFSDQCNSNDNMSEASKGSSKTGTAVKTSTSQWTIHFDGSTMTATDADLMDCNKFYVEQIVEETDDLKRKKKDAKRKRTRKAEQSEREKRIHAAALDKMRELQQKEYNNLCERMQSGNEFKFEEFLEMVKQMRKPFVVEVEGHEVSLTQDDCAIMMESSAVQAITDSLFFTKDTQDKTNQNEQNK